MKDLKKEVKEQIEVLKADIEVSKKYSMCTKQEEITLNLFERILLDLENA